MRVSKPLASRPLIASMLEKNAEWEGFTVKGVVARQKHAAKHQLQIRWHLWRTTISGQAYRNNSSGDAESASCGRSVQCPRLPCLTRPFDPSACYSPFEGCTEFCAPWQALGQK